MGKTQRQNGRAVGDNVTQQKNISDAPALELSRKKRLTDTENAMSSSAKLSRAIEDKVCGTGVYVDEVVSITERSIPRLLQIGNAGALVRKTQRASRWIGGAQAGELCTDVLPVLATETCLSCG